MRRYLVIGVTIVAAWLRLSQCSYSAEPSADDRGWTDDFGIVKEELSATGRNPYFCLEPGCVLVLESKDEQVIITVMDQTKTIDGVETRVVEERETKRGKLVEVSRNYFAISRRTNCVFYFGEEVDIYKGDNIVSHDGAWLSGLHGARFGMMVPGQPLLRARFQQEVAPDVAMDRAEIVSLLEKVEVPAGTFERCMKTEETTPLEKGKEYKLYGPGVGLLIDGDLKLIKAGHEELKKEAK